MLVGIDTAAVAAAADRAAGAIVGDVGADGAHGGRSTAGPSRQGTVDRAGGDGDGDDDRKTRTQRAAPRKREEGGGGGGEENVLRNPRGLFRYELIRDIEATTTSSTTSTTHGGDSANAPSAAIPTTTGITAAGSGSGSVSGSGSSSRSAIATAAATAGSRQLITNSSSWHNQPRQLRRPSLRGTTPSTTIRSADGTRGIRVRLKRLVEGPSLGSQLRRQRERDLGETPVTSGEGVLFEAVQEGSGLESRTVIRVLSR